MRKALIAAAACFAVENFNLKWITRLVIFSHADTHISQNAELRNKLHINCYIWITSNLSTERAGLKTSWVYIRSTPSGQCRISPPLYSSVYPRVGTVAIDTIPTILHKIQPDGPPDDHRRYGLFVSVV